MNWLPYPKNIPEKDGVYLVSFKGYIKLVEFKSHHRMYKDGVKYYTHAWINEELGGEYEDVIAFMEVEPYYYFS